MAHNLDLHTLESLMSVWIRCSWFGLGAVELMCMEGQVPKSAIFLVCVLLSRCCVGVDGHTVAGT